MTSPWRGQAVLLALLAALAVVATLALFFGGAANVGPREVWLTLSGGAIDPAAAPIAHALVFDYRLPRIALMAIAGTALALAGTALQSCLQNPLADPSLLGVSGGASLGAVLVITTSSAQAWRFALPLGAFAGAMAALTLVYLLAHVAGRPTAAALLLTGVAVGSLTSAIVSVLLLAAGQHRVHEIVAWLLGSGDGATWERVRLALPPVLLGSAALLLARRTIDALALGEEQALSLGIDLLKTRAAIFLCVALVAGGAVSVTGPIAFVGLMVPHMLRSLVGPAARHLLPAAALGGAILLIGCDLVARIVSLSVDIPVGVVTSLLGVPFFLLLLARSRGTL